MGSVLVRVLCILMLSLKTTEYDTQYNHNIHRPIAMCCQILSSQPHRTVMDMTVCIRVVCVCVLCCVRPIHHMEDRTVLSTTYAIVQYYTYIM